MPDVVLLLNGDVNATLDKHLLAAVGGMFGHLLWHTDLDDIILVYLLTFRPAITPMKTMSIYNNITKLSHSNSWLLMADLDLESIDM